MTIPLGGVHVDVTLNVDDIGPRLQKMLTRSAQQAGKAMERQLAGSGRRAGDKFAAEFSRTTRQKLGSQQFGSTISRATVPPAERAGATAGESFAVQFGRGLSRGLGGSATRRPFAETLGRGAGATTLAVGKLSVGIGAVTGAASLAFGALAPLVNVVGGLGAGAIQASGALALIPAAGAAAAASVATLAVGFQGLGDAFKAINEDDPAKYAEALEKLSPAARDVAESFKAAKPALTDLRKTVQEELLQGVGDQIDRFSTTLLPVLRRGLTDVAGGLNKQFDQVFAGLTDRANMADFGGIFKNIGSGAEAAAPGLRSLVDAFTDITRVGSSFLPQLGRGFSSLAKDFEGFIQRSRDSGALADFINDGLSAVQQFGRIVRDLGVGLVNVFNAAEQAGGGLFNQVERIASGFRKFTESAKGQAQLGTLFASLRRAGDAMAPVFAQIFDTFVQLAPVLAGIAEKIGPKLATIISRVGDALAGVGPEVGDALASIGDALAEILPAVVELAGPFTTLVASALRPMVPVVQALAPVLEVLADALSGVLNAVTDAGLGGIVGLAGAFLLLRRRVRMLSRVAPGAAAALGALTGRGRGGRGLNPAAAPGLVAFGKGADRAAKGGGKLAKVAKGGGVALFLASLAIPEEFGANLYTVNEGITKLNKGADQLMGGDRKFDLVDTLNAPGTLLTAAGDGFRGLTALITGNETALANLRKEYTDEVTGRAVAGYFGVIRQSALDTATAVGGAGTQVQQALGTNLSSSIGSAAGVVQTGMTSVQTAVTTGLGAAVTQATGFGGSLGAKLSEGLGTAKTRVSTGMSGIGSAVATGSISAAGRASVFGGVVGSKITAGMGVGRAAAVTGMSGIGASVAAGAAGAGQRASAMRGPLGSNVTAAANAAQSLANAGMGRLGDAIRRGAHNAANQASGLAGQLRSNIGTVNLYGVGASMMSSLGAGIAAGAAAAASQARGVAASIRGLFPASPAKWGPFAGQGHPEILGRKLMGFLASGIGRGEQAVSAAARRGAVAASGVFPPGGFAAAGRFGGSSSTTSYSRTVNAPITVNAPAADPRAVAAQVHNRFDAIAATLPAF